MSCGMCNGRGSCWVCNGSGINGSLQRCAQCGGGGSCSGCGGTGQDSFAPQSPPRVSGRSTRGKIGSGSGVSPGWLILFAFLGFWLFAKSNLWRQSPNPTPTGDTGGTEFVSVADVLRERQTTGNSTPPESVANEAAQPVSPAEATQKHAAGDFTPYLIECTEVSIMLHDQPPVRPIRRWEITTDAYVKSLLDRAASDANSVVVFLVRSDGMGSYYPTRKLCVDRSIRNALVAISGDAKLDLDQIDFNRAITESLAEPPAFAGKAAAVIQADGSSATTLIDATKHNLEKLDNQIGQYERDVERLDEQLRESSLPTQERDKLDGQRDYRLRTLLRLRKEQDRLLKKEKDRLLRALGRDE